MITNILRGVFTGLTASYLNQQVQDHVKAENKEVWKYVALQANHLLPLVGAIFARASVKSHFSLIQHSVFLLTPAVLLANHRYKKAFPEASLASECTRVYYAATVVLSLALFGLGDHAAALTTLSMLALDQLAQHVDFPKAGKKAFSYLTQAAAVGSAISYGAQVLQSNAVWSKIAMAVSAVLIPKDITLGFPKDNSSTWPAGQRWSTSKDKEMDRLHRGLVERASSGYPKSDQPQGSSDTTWRRLGHMLAGLTPPLGFLTAPGA